MPLSKAPLTTPLTVDKAPAFNPRNPRYVVNINANKYWADWLSGLVTGLFISGDLDFPSTSAQSSTDAVIAVSGVLSTDLVLVTPISSLRQPASFYEGFVSNANEITVTFHNYSGSPINPLSGLFSIVLLRH